MLTTALAIWAAGAIAPLQVSVEGEGYLRFANDGRIVYAKSATLAVREGRLAHSAGASLMPLALVPNGAQSIAIAPDGTISAIVAGSQKPIARITVALFPANETLAASGSYLVARQRPKLEYPGENGAGKLVTDAAPSLVPPAAKTGALTIRIPISSQVPSSRILLKDFASIAGPATWISRIGAIDFGPTPKAGFPNKITRQRLAAKLKLAGLEEGAYLLEAPEVFEVGAAGQTVAPDQFVQAAIAAASEKFGAAMSFQVESEPAAFTAPAGALTLKAENVTANQTKLQIPVAVYVDGKRVNAQIVHLASPALAIAVKAGELVKVSFVSNGLAVDVPGRAKRAGRMGESIEVEVLLGEPATKTVHLATVKGPGLVEVRI